MTDLRSALVLVASAARTAEQPKADGVGQDMRHLVDGVLFLQHHIDAELAARFPAYRKIDQLAIFSTGDHHDGWEAVWALALLRMLADAPDLVQLSLQRIADAFERAYFEGDDHVK